MKRMVKYGYLMVILDTFLHSLQGYREFFGPAAECKEN